MKLQQAHDFLSQLDSEFRRQYLFPEADNRSRGLQEIKFLIEDHATVLHAVKVAREMASKGRNAQDCLDVIFRAVGDKV